jgi:catechol 2,3-dioxygenase-like lactoylglutathione lyase family enzyme
MPIPTVTGVDHVGFNVPDIEQALGFFIDVLGCELLDRQAPHPFSLAPSATIAVAMLRFDARTVFELLEVHAPGQLTAIPTMTDTGGYHLALTVTDLDAAIAYLRAQPGVAIREPVALPSGRRRAFCTTPWGMSLQLIQPAGEAVY